MLHPKTAACLVLVLALASCGKGCGSEGGGEGDAATASASDECGKGGTVCPEGLECLTRRGGERACGPMAVEASVLIKDATLDGRCAFEAPDDTWPGASIASVQVIGVDGSVKGHGRLEWQQAGYEVAADRGTPPDGSAFSGDACTDAYNLGCDGQAVFEIVDDGGAIQKLREGEEIVVHLRGQDACGEEVADELAGTICNDPAAAASGNLESCTFRVRMIEARSDMYGPDRMGGTIQGLSAP